MKQVKLKIDRKTYRAVKKACKRKTGIINKLKDILKKERWLCWQKKNLNQ